MLFGVQPSTAPARPVARIARISLTPELFYLGEPVVAGPGDPPAHHVRAALDLRLRALLQHDGGTRTGQDIEDLHQMRVGGRRLRVALPLLQQPVADRHNWTIPRLRAEIEAREGVQISRSQLSKALRKKSSVGDGRGTR